MDTIICICGRSASGKDTITDMVSKKLGIPKIISFTDRPRRDGEDDKHIFLTKEQCDKTLNSHTTAAYTEINGYRYFTTIEQINSMLRATGSLLYIIDPNGIESLRQQMPDKNILTIYINVSREECKKRAVGRGDNLKTYHDRSVSEHSQFTKFCRTSAFDYAVPNRDLDKAVDIIWNIIETEIYDENSD